MYYFLNLLKYIAHKTIGVYAYRKILRLSGEKKKGNQWTWATNHFYGFRGSKFVGQRAVNVLDSDNNKRCAALKKDMDNLERTGWVEPAVDEGEEVMQAQRIDEAVRYAMTPVEGREQDDATASPGQAEGVVGGVATGHGVSRGHAAARGRGVTRGSVRGVGSVGAGSTGAGFAGSGSAGAGSTGVGSAGVGSARAASTRAASAHARARAASARADRGGGQGEGRAAVLRQRRARHSTQAERQTQARSSQSSAPTAEASRQAQGSSPSSGTVAAATDDTSAEEDTEEEADNHRELRGRDSCIYPSRAALPSRVSISPSFGLNLEHFADYEKFLPRGNSRSAHGHLLAEEIRDLHQAARHHYDPTTGRHDPAFLFAMFNAEVVASSDEE